MLLYCVAASAGVRRPHPSYADRIACSIKLDSSEALRKLERYEGERGTLWSSYKRPGAAGSRVRRQNAYATFKHRKTNRSTHS